MGCEKYKMTNESTILSLRARSNEKSDTLKLSQQAPRLRRTLRTQKTLGNEDVEIVFPLSSLFRLRRRQIQACLIHIRTPAIFWTSQHRHLFTNHSRTTSPNAGSASINAAT